MLGIEEGINSYTAAAQPALAAAPNLSEAYFGSGDVQVSGLNQQSVSPAAGMESPIALATESFGIERASILTALAGELGMKLVTAPIENGFKAMFKEPKQAA